MLTKNEIKQIRSLQLKKGRDELGCFVCEGNKLVSELLASSFRVREIFATHEWAENHNEHKDIRLISSQEMEKISQMTTAPGVLAVVEEPKELKPDIEKLKNQLFFVLDGVTDPGNLGTIIRIADWFGMTDIFCSPNTVERFNPKTVQASMGSIFRVNVQYLGLLDFMNQCSENNIPLSAAVMNGNTDFKISTGGIILGSESHGISDAILNKKVEKITIPSFGKAESLNVAIAAGIIVSKIKW